MKTNEYDNPEKVINQEDQNEPLNPQDDKHNDTTVTADDKKKGYSEGNRNDSGTANEPIDEIITTDKEKK